MKWGRSRPTAPNEASESSGSGNAINMIARKGTFAFGMQGDFDDKVVTGDDAEYYKKHAGVLGSEYEWVSMAHKKANYQIGVTFDRWCRLYGNGGLRIWNGAKDGEKGGDIHIVRHTSEFLTKHCDHGDYNTRAHMTWTTDSGKNRDALLKLLKEEKSETELLLTSQAIRGSAPTAFTFAIADGVHHTGEDGKEIGADKGLVLGIAMDWASGRFRHNQFVEVMVDMNSEGIHTNPPQNARGFAASRGIGVFAGKTQTGSYKIGQGLWVDEKEGGPGTEVAVGHIRGANSDVTGFWTDGNTVQLGILTNKWSGTSGIAIGAAHLDAVIALTTGSTWGLGVKPGEVVVGNVHGGGARTVYSGTTVKHYASAIEHHGAQNITIHADGILRLEGASVVIDADGVFRIDAGMIRCQTPADDQHGIYARYG